MSWNIVNQILGLAAVDKEFAQELLKEPLTAAQARGFQLTPREQRVFNAISVSNLQEFSQHLIQELDHNQSAQD